MPSKRKSGRPEIVENARAGREADQFGAGRTTGRPPAPAQPDAAEEAAFREARDEARAEGRMQGTKDYELGHYHANAKAEGDPTNYPPNFSWGPRSGYAEEQMSGAPYNLSKDDDDFVRWREERLQELDRTFHRWRADLAHQLEESYKRWTDAQQQAFSEDLARWQADRPGAASADKAARSRKAAKRR